MFRRRWPLCPRKSSCGLHQLHDAAPFQAKGQPCLLGQVHPPPAVDNAIHLLYHFRIDGDTYLTKPVVPSETAGFVGSLNLFYIAAPSKGNSLRGLDAPTCAASAFGLHTGMYLVNVYSVFKVLGGDVGFCWVLESFLHSCSI